jgi:putative oxidoreductase
MRRKSMAAAHRCRVFVFCHGLQKVFGLFGGVNGAGTAAPLFSLFGVAGIIEIIGGLLVVSGFFTGTVAFILSGQMAVAYFIGHFPASIWPRRK